MSEGLHESREQLSPRTLDQHRAVASLMEELEAVDWYDQRVDATDDESLRAILAHNRDEEKEHAAMLLEWLRRRDAAWNEQLRTYLFTDGPILEIEESEGERPEAPGDESLGIGGMKGEDDVVPTT
jgi:ferritin-like protein